MGGGVRRLVSTPHSLARLDRLRSKRRWMDLVSQFNQDRKRNKTEPLLEEVQLFVRALSENGMWENIEKCIEQFPQLDLEKDKKTNLALHFAYAKAGELGRCTLFLETLAQRSKEMGWNLVMMENSLLSAFIAAERFKEGLEFYEKQWKSEWTKSASTMILMLKLAVGAGCPDKGISLFWNAISKVAPEKDWRMGEEILGNLIMAYAQASRFDETIVVREQILRQSPDLRGIVSSELHIDSFTSACVWLLNRDSPELAPVLSKINASQPINMRFWKKLVFECATPNVISRAVKLIDVVTQTGTLIPATSEENIRSWNNIMSQICLTGSSKDALWITGLFFKRKIPLTFPLCKTLLRSQGLKEPIGQGFVSMLKSQMWINNDALLGHWINYLSRREDWKVTLAIYGVIRSKGYRPMQEIFTDVSIACSQAFQYKKLLSIMFDRFESNLNICSRDLLAFFSSVARLETSSAKWVSTSFKFLHSQVPDAFDINVYNQVIFGSVNLGQWNLALEVLGEIRSRELRPNSLTYAGVLSSLMRGEHWVKVGSILEEITAEKIAWNPVFCKAKILYLASKGDFPGAQAVFEESTNRERGLSPDIDLKIRANLPLFDAYLASSCPWNAFLQASLHCCKLDSAQAILNTMLRARISVSGETRTVFASFLRLRMWLLSEVDKRKFSELRRISLSSRQFSSMQ